MADEIEGLSGTEIIADVLAHVEKELKSSCDLRAEDCYGRGYSGKITINLQLQDVDTAKVDIEVNLQPSPQLLASTPEVPEGATITPIEFISSIDIPLEENLTEVRNRTKENSITKPSETLDGEETPSTHVAVTRRKYTRRTPIAEQTVIADGGAVDVNS